MEGISTISNTSLHMIPNTCQHKDLYVNIVQVYKVDQPRNNLYTQVEHAPERYDTEHTHIMNIFRHKRQ